MLPAPSGEAPRGPPASACGPVQLGGSLLLLLISPVTWCVSPSGVNAAVSKDPAPTPEMPAAKRGGPPVSLPRTDRRASEQTAVPALRGARAGGMVLRWACGRQAR